MNLEKSQVEAALKRAGYNPREASVLAHKTVELLELYDKFGESYK